MTTLLEVRERVLAIYGAHESLFLMAAKFVLALLSFLCINSRIGYSETLSGGLLAVLLSLICALLPMSLIVAVTGLVVLAQMYALSTETAIMAAVLYLLLFLLYFRFSPRDGAILLLLPVCHVANLHYAIPIAAGLFLSPASVVPVSFGLVITYYIRFVSENATSITSVSSDELAGRFRFVVDGLFQNRELLLMLIAFALSLVVTYVVRRLKIANAWTIAEAAGAVTVLLSALIGDMLLDAQISVGLLFLGTVLSLAIVFVVQFFVRQLDYSRTEDVQFEDDEYYYYVHAVPKVSLAVRSRTAKKINASRGIAHPYAQQEPGRGENFREEEQGG